MLEELKLRCRRNNSKLSQKFGAPKLLKPLWKCPDHSPQSHQTSMVAPLVFLVLKVDRQRKTGFQGHLYLHSELEAGLGCLTPYLKQNETK